MLSRETLAGRVVLGAAVPLLLVVLWATFAGSNSLSASIIPSPQQVALALYDFVIGGIYGGPYSGAFWVHFTTSLQRVLMGFALGSALGVSLGIVLGHSRLAARLLEPGLQLLRAVPGICWLPLALVWFGLGTPSAVFLIFLGSFYPILLSTMHGVRQVEPNLIRAARMLGVNDRQLLFRVILPAAFPEILNGMRIGMAYSWIYVVLGEMTGVPNGLGATLWTAREILRTDLIIALMIVIGALGALIDWLGVRAVRGLTRGRIL